MADVETKDAAVSNAHLEADSLEFAVNTNLPVMADSASPEGASPSLQELIEAELNVRLCQPDSLEPPTSPDPSSLISCDSIEPAPHTLAPSLIPSVAPAPVKTTAPTTGPTTGLTLDSLLDLDSLQGMADTESGIDVLSPTKLDDLSILDMDSLESSSDLPGSSHCSPEPTITLTTKETTVVVQKDTLLTIAQAGDSLLPGTKSIPSLEAETQLLVPLQDDTDAASLGDLQAAPPLLRISESNLTTASETRSEHSQVSQEVTRSSTPDSLTSFEGASFPQDNTVSQDADVRQECTQDGSVFESILMQKSAVLQNTVTLEGSASCVLDSASVREPVESQQLDALRNAVNIQQNGKSSALLDSVSPLDSIVSQEDSVVVLDSVPQQECIVTQDTASLLDIPLQQHRNGDANIGTAAAAAAGDLIHEETVLPPSLKSSEAPTEPNPLLTLDDPASPASLSSPQGQDYSPPSPSLAGALPLSGTNSVCGGDSNSARDDCGALGVCSGRVETTTTALCGSGGGGGVGVSGPVSSLQNGCNVSSCRR